MRAAVLHQAKDLRLEDVAERPLADDEVRLAFGAGGICGSDLSYFFKGRVGDFPVSEPLILGHEVAGEVTEVGREVTRVGPGDRIAVDPSRPCLVCPACRGGRSNLCRDMRFLGSAAVVPHVQGAFSETLVVREDMCHRVPDTMSFETAACAEPLSVAVHAVNRSGGVLEKNVIVAGAGPIGCLVVAVARHAGAGRITVIDLVDEPLQVARALGADEVINVATEPDLLAAYEAHKGSFDLAFEVTGAVPALASLLKVTRPGGRVVQVGMLPTGEVPLAANLLMAQEIDYLGSFRFHREFTTAVQMLITGRIDVTPIQTQSLPLNGALAAFETAADRRRSIKVHVHF
jgi:L-idonate 5-dehydrogenase